MRSHYFDVAFSYTLTNHLKNIESTLRDDFYFVYFYFLGNIFQNLKVSSPAPVTIDVPSGFIAK